jgi:hypothetical protein
MHDDEVEGCCVAQMGVYIDLAQLRRPSMALLIARECRNRLFHGQLRLHGGYVVNLSRSLGQVIVRSGELRHLPLLLEVYIVISPNKESPFI